MSSSIDRNKQLLHIRESVVHGSHLLTLSGRLDLGARQIFSNTLEEQTQTYWKRMLIDVQHVTFLDTAGLRILASAARRIRAMDREVLIVNPRDQILALLVLSKFPALVPVADANSDYSAFTTIS